MPRANSYAPAEDEWLAGVFPTCRDSELPAMHAEAFPGGWPRTESALKNRAHKLGLHKAWKQPSSFWTPERCEWFSSYVPGHTESEISAEHERLFGTPLTEGQIGGAKTKLGVKSGTHGGRFFKGQAPWNAGKSWSEWMPPESAERSRATQFKRGEVHGFAAMHDSPIGTERVSKDGYIQVRVGRGIQDKPNSNFRFKHHIVWEEANGRKVEKGMKIVFADGDKLNFDPDNLVAVDNGTWCHLKHQGYEYSDRETLLLAVKIAELDRARYRVEMRSRDCKVCGGKFAPRFKNQRTCDECLGRC